MLNNPILKLWYKIFNKSKYQIYKHKKAQFDRIKFYNEEVYDNILNIQKNIDNKKELSFLHSGHMGDLIYSLAVIKELSKSHACKLYIEINKTTPPGYENHPSGKYFLDKRIVQLLLPLLMNQKYLKTEFIHVKMIINTMKIKNVKWNFLKKKNILYPIQNGFLM